VCVCVCVVCVCVCVLCIRLSQLGASLSDPFKLKAGGQSVEVVCERNE